MNRVRSLSSPIASFPLDLLLPEMKLYMYLESQGQTPKTEPKPVYNEIPLELDIRNTLETYFD